MNAELKSCPMRCRSIPQRGSKSPSIFYVECMGCGLRGPWGTNPGSAEEGWNRLALASQSGPQRGEVGAKEIRTKLLRAVREGVIDGLELSDDDVEFLLGESGPVWKMPIAVVVNNNQPGWTAIVETDPNITLPVGMKLYSQPQSASSPPPQASTPPAVTDEDADRIALNVKFIPEDGICYHACKVARAVRDACFKLNKETKNEEGR